jgi:hypothetical protein
MAITINEKHCYSQSADDLFKIYYTEAWIPQRYEGIGMRNINVKKCVNNGDTWEVECVREVKAEVPGALAKFAKEWNVVTQHETWVKKGDSYDCNFTVAINGLPVEIVGHMVVQPDGDGSANVIELNISCPIPFVGKAAEKFVAGDSQKSMDQEHAWIKNFLNENC